MTPSRRLVWGVRALVLGAALGALLPLGLLVADWAAYAEAVGRPLEPTPPRGYVGVRWADAPGGGVEVVYVFPGSPGAEAGVRPGDRLARLDGVPAESAAAAERYVERATGAVVAVEALRDGRPVSADVRVARYPPFLYPLSRTLWGAAAWGFAFVAVLHLLALLTVLPLARRSARAGRSAVLIGAAFLWVGGNLARIAWVSVQGAPGSGSAVEAALFDALTLAALAGWLAFPALLLRHSALSDRLTRAAAAPVLPALLVAPGVLGGLLAVATVRGHAGPLPPDALVAPAVFYACVTIAAAMALAARTGAREDARPLRVGRAVVLAVSVAGAAFALRLRPADATDAELGAGWFLTALQLVSLLPVGLLSLSTLRVGQFDAVLLRAAAYGATLAVVFAVVAGGAAVLEAVVPGGAGPVALGALVAAVVALADRLAPVVRRRVAGLVRTEREAARQRLDRFAERIQFLVDPAALAAEAAEATGEALGACSAVVWLRIAPPGDDAAARWVSATFRPEPPHFTHAELDRVWDRLRADGRPWAAQDELREAELPAADAERLRAIGVALAVPVASGRTGEPAGLLVVGRRDRRRSVYTTDDAARLRVLGGQLALAAERLGLIERERALVRQTAEAELAALRAQINPHFLFNALNTVAALIAERPGEAERTVESLAGLFRDVLTASGRASVPLADELRLVRRYLDVERARFGEALCVSVDAEPAALERPVPAFAVQTLVENAVKHGVERRRGGGRVDVRARVEPDGELTVTVADTGVGIPALFGRSSDEVPGEGTCGPGASGDGTPGARDAPAPRGGPDTSAPAASVGAGPPPEPSAPGSPAADSTVAEAFAADAVYGVGLSNVAARLRLLFGTSDRLALASSPAGTVATLRLPPP